MLAFEAGPCSRARSSDLSGSLGTSGRQLQELHNNRACLEDSAGQVNTSAHPYLACIDGDHQLPTKDLITQGLLHISSMARVQVEWPEGIKLCG